MDIVVKSFDELTTVELYEILKARAAIFVVEQNCVYQDLDDVDYQSLHVFYQEDNRVLAYLRAFYKEKGVVQIGRVLTMQRGNGWGGILLHETRATIHLVDVLGAEHKHHLALRVAVAIHIAHRLHIALLTLGQLALKLFLLGIQQHQRAVQRGDMRADGVNQALLVVNLAAQHQHVLHLLLHPAVQLGLLLLLFLNILTQLLLGSLHLLPFGQRLLGC